MTTLLRIAAVAVLTVSSITAHAETTVTEADTLVVVTPHAPVVVTQSGSTSTAPGATLPASQGPAVATSSAPQNEDWNNVSHINGAPVKVGERGQYLHAFKKTNISANPFGLFFGVYDIGVSHALSQHIAASVSITTLHDSEDDFTAIQVSATLPLYFRRTYSGPFLEGGLLARTYESYCHDACGGNTYVGPQMLFGWHWSFDSGLNIALAAGVMKRMNNTNEYGSNTEPNAYFRVGYAF